MSLQVFLQNVAEKYSLCLSDLKNEAKKYYFDDKYIFDLDHLQSYVKVNEIEKVSIYSLVLFLQKVHFEGKTRVELYNTRTRLYKLESFKNSFSLVLGIFAGASIGFKIGYFVFDAISN